MLISVILCGSFVKIILIQNLNPFFKFTNLKDLVDFENVNSTIDSNDLM